MPLLVTHNCRGCSDWIESPRSDRGNGNLKPFLSLGSQALPDWRLTPVWEEAPLDLVECERCGLLQLQEVVPRERLFNEHYGYRSGVSETMRAALAEVASQGLGFIKGTHNLWLDIGANDGTLGSFVHGQCRVAGFEPSAMDYTLMDGAVRFVEPFNAQRWHDYFSEKKAQVITSIAMFYSMDTPQQFVHDIEQVLAEDGVWICQMNDQQALIENLAYDIIGHEHCCLYSLGSFMALLAPTGLEVFDLQRVDLNGGGFRLFAGHQGQHEVQHGAINAQLDREAALDRSGFAAAVSKHAQALYELLAGLKAQGKSVHLKGASTRISTMLQAAGINGELDLAADRSPQKWGCYVPGTDILIVSEEESRQHQPDYYLLGIPYLEQLQQRERAFLERGGHFISPYEAPRVLS